MPASPLARRISYVSDVEGHWDFFCSFVNQSDGIHWRFAGGNHRMARTGEELELELEEGWDFVFGGDACDKGPGTVRFLEAMVRIKKKYPDRVVLLLGNRDINKMRFTAELADEEMTLERAQTTPLAYWVQGSTSSWWNYLCRLAAQQAGVDQEAVTAQMIQDLNLLTKANKIRYMLQYDMGSLGEFDFRRQELAHIRGVQPDEVNDDEVIASYLQSLEPGGWMLEYLKLAQLASYNQGILFVHGQIIGNQFPHGQVKGADTDDTAWSVTVVPGEEDPIMDLQEWIRRLNAWSASEVDAWVAQPTWETPPQEATNASWGSRGGADLIAYGTPGSPVPTVVYCRYLTPACMPLEYPADLTEYLLKQGVRQVVVGHTPHGNAPTVIRNSCGDGPGVTLVMGDTSFSHMKANLYFTGDNRGLAVSAIVLDANGCSVHGHTEKNQVISYDLAPGDDDDEGCPVGWMQPAREASDGKRFFVKAQLTADSDCCSEDDTVFLMNYIKGFTYEYALLNSEQLNLVKRGADVEVVASRHVRRVPSGSGDIFGFSFQGADNDQLVRYLFGDDEKLTPPQMSKIFTDHHLCKALYLAFPGMAVSEIIRQADLNGDGFITRDEFLALCEMKRDVKHRAIYFELKPEGDLEQNAKVRQLLYDDMGTIGAESLVRKEMLPELLRTHLQRDCLPRELEAATTALQGGKELNPSDWVSWVMEDGAPQNNDKVFPEQLGPFACTPTQQLKAEHLNLFLGDTEAWASEGRPCDLPRSNCHGETLQAVMEAVPGEAQLQTHLSALQPVLLALADRKSLCIPEDATHFVWSYPFNADWERVLEQANVLPENDPDVAMLANGAFLYLRVEGDEAVPLQLTALGGRRRQLQFFPSQQVPDECMARLVALGELHPVTLRRLLKVGATHFTWIAPGSDVLGPQECVRREHGGFLYMFAEPE